MKKKLYEKPSMKVFEFKQKPQLLVTSSPTPQPGDPWYWE